MSPNTNFKEVKYEDLKQNITFGPIHFYFDLTRGLSKKEWELEKRLQNQEHFISKTGRIIIPKLNII